MDIQPKRKAARDRAANQNDTQADYNLLRKHHAVMHATADPELSRGEVAVYAQIVDRYNAQRGAAWPSMDRLAFDTGLSRRAIPKIIEKLCRGDYLQITKHGNRATSNRYLPTFHEYSRKENPATDTDTIGNPSSLNIGNSSSTCSEPQFPTLVNPSSLEPTYEPEQQARGKEVGVSLPPPLAAARAAPGGLPLAADSNGLRYPEFWAAYPKRANVGTAEEAIDDALTAGVKLATIVDGARLYAEWLKAQPWADKARYTKAPQNFIRGKHWLDDWTVAAKHQKEGANGGIGQTKQSQKKTEAKTGAKKTEARKKMKNPEFTKWEMERDRMYNELHPSEWAKTRSPAPPRWITLDGG